MDLINELAQVASKEERVNVDLRQPTQRKSERILQEIAKSRKKKKDGSRGRVMSTYFSAIDAAEIDERCETAGLSTSSFLHEATQRFLQTLRSEDGTIIAANGKGQEISAELTAQSQKRLEKLAEMILTPEERDAALDKAFPESAEARRKVRERQAAEAAPITSLSSLNPREEDAIEQDRR